MALAAHRKCGIAIHLVGTGIDDFRKRLLKDCVFPVQEVLPGAGCIRVEQLYVSGLLAGGWLRQ